MTAGGLIWVPTAPREPGGGDGDLEGTAEISYKAGIAGPVKDNPYLLHTSLFLHLPVFPWEVGWCPLYRVNVPENVGEYFQSLQFHYFKGGGEGR